MLNFLAAVSGNGAGGGGSFESIATASPATGTTTGVAFTSIPSTYQHLQLRVFGLRNAVSELPLRLQFNSDTGANYVHHRLSGDGATATAAGTTGASNILLDNLGNSTNPGCGIIDIHDYASTAKNKTVRAIIGYDWNGSGNIYLRSGAWLSTSAINRIDITTGGAPVLAPTTFALYGIKGA